MAQAKQVAQVNNFTGGLVTEVTELTFPPNTTSDEDNCDLLVKGNRKRRLGMDFEDSYSLSTASWTDDNLLTYAIHTYAWTGVAGSGNRNFLVLQMGATLSFYDNSTSPLSSGLKSFTVNLNSYLAPSATTAEADRVSMVAGRGDLFVVSPKIIPIQITYNPDTDTISVKSVSIRIRDFNGVDDGLAVDAEPSTLSAAHKYNLLNQGWFTTPQGMDPLAIFYTEAGVYPANNVQWFLAKKTTDQKKPTSGTYSANQAGEVDTYTLRKLAIGTTKVARGHYIIDPFYIDRSAVSGVAGLSVVSTTQRPGAVAFYAGRVAYALNSDVYLSQVLTLDRDNAGKCYQENDPTSEDASDLVNSDGVVIPIPEAGSIRALATVGHNLIVIANNGAWAIAGVDGGFKADDFSVQKLTSEGIVSRQGFINVEDVTAWIGETSIMILQTDTSTGLPQAISLTDQKIKSFYLDIPSDAKANMIGQYDTATHIMQFLWKDDDLAPVSSSPYYYNRILNLNTQTGSFYPYTISRFEPESPFVASAFRTPTLNQTVDVINVVDSDGALVIDDSSDQVTADDPITIGLSTFTKYLIIVPNLSTTDNNITFGSFKNNSFTDWKTYDILDIGADYESYLETGYDIQGDVARMKQAPYIVTHCSRTEHGYTVNGDGEVIFLNPSSLWLQARWDWSDNASSGKWSTPQQVYKQLRNYIPDEGTLTYEPGNRVVTAKSRIRGRGRALQLRFSSETGYDFNLLGWGTVFTGNTVV